MEFGERVARLLKARPAWGYKARARDREYARQMLTKRVRARARQGIWGVARLLVNRWG